MPEQKDLGRFTGRVAVVTGAASGIGRATAQRLAFEGAAVVLTDLSPAVEEAAADIAANGAIATHVIADVAEERDWQRVITQADRFGPVDVLVSNAFVIDVAPAHELGPGSWDRQLAVNLGASYLGFRACLPGLRASTAMGGGAAVLVSSVHALIGLPGHPAYAAAKGGLCALGKQLAVEYGPEVRVNSILPGPILTPTWDRIPEEARRRSASATALGRLGHPEEVAATIAFLASADGSFITGASLVVDGGWSIAKDSS